MEKCSVSKATLGRLPCYLQHLRAILKNNDEYVSATTIAKELSLGEVQVRKDLNSISGAGRPKIGYAVKDLIESIENALGYSNLAKAIIVGAGKLGQALLNFEGFGEYGVEISAAFDIVAKNNIKAIWNFTPKKLNVPKDVLVQQENLALSLAHLNNQLVNQN